MAVISIPNVVGGGFFNIPLPGEDPRNVISQTSYPYVSTNPIVLPSQNVNPGAGQYSYTNSYNPFYTLQGTQPIGTQPTLPGAGGGGLCRSLAQAACGTIPDPILRAGCMAAASVLPDCGPGSGGGSTFQPTTCPPGKALVNGQCVDVTPGMTTPAEASGGTTIGMGGVAARLSYDCGNIKGHTIKCCPKAHVLGVDNLCYAKGTIPRQWRKWKPGRKPLVTAGDLRVLSRFSSVQGRLKKAAGRAGLTATKKGAGRSRKHAAGCQCITCKR